MKKIIATSLMTVFMFSAPVMAEENQAKDQSERTGMSQEDRQAKRSDHKEKRSEHKAKRDARLQELAQRLQLSESQQELAKAYMSEKYQNSEKGQDHAAKRAEKKEAGQQRMQKIAEKCGIDLTGDLQTDKEALGVCKSRLDQQKP
jgi:hypothetical protein